MLLWELFYRFTPLTRYTLRSQISQYGRGFIPGSLAIGSESHWRSRRTGSRSRTVAGNRTAFKLSALSLVADGRISFSPSSTHLHALTIRRTAALPFPSFCKVNFNSNANLYDFFTKIRNSIFYYKIFRNYNVEYSCTFTTIKFSSIYQWQYMGVKHGDSLERTRM